MPVIPVIPAVISASVKVVPGAIAEPVPVPTPKPLAMPTAVIPSGGAIAPGNPPAIVGLAIIIAPIIIPASEISSGISSPTGA